MPRKGAQVLHPVVGLTLSRAFIYGTAAGLFGTIAYVLVAYRLLSQTSSLTDMRTA